MVLQMPVYREITAIEPRVFLGLSWRQLACAVPLALENTGLASLFFYVNQDWNITTWQMALMFVVSLPLAALGWWRPQGLMPEKYFGYVWRHYWSKNLYFRDGDARDVRVGLKSTIKERR